MAHWGLSRQKQTNIFHYLVKAGDRGSIVVKVLCYKSEGRWFDGVIGIFHNPSARTMALGSTQPLTEMSTRTISWQ